MRYSKDWLLAAIKRNEKFDYLLFHGEERSVDGTVTSACLSQWYEAGFELEGIKYATAEHYMMAEKARLFGDDQALTLILASKTPREAKELGRKVVGFDNKVWKEHRIDVVVRGTVAKFSQNFGFAGWLVATAPKVIAEADMWDKIWGIGIEITAPGARDPKQWKGKNLMGFALMEARDILADRQKQKQK